MFSMVILLNSFSSDNRTPLSIFCDSVLVIMMISSDSSLSWKVFTSSCTVKGNLDGYKSLG